MITDKTNSKALNLANLENTHQKVTVGFKCNPKVKLALANDATKRGLTLSEYTESLIANMDHSKESLQNEIVMLKERLSFYENDILMALFKEYKGRTINFLNADNVEFQIEIKSPQDIYTILINSFKTKA